MSVDYDSIAAEVDGAFAEVNQGVVTLIKVTPGEVDPDDPLGEVTDSTVTYRLKSVVDPVADKMADGTTIKVTDNLVTASPIMTKTHVDDASVTNVEEVVEIEPGDEVRIDGKKVSAEVIKRTPRVGVCLFWEVVVRG